MLPLYPLTFHPVLKRYLWGGRRLGNLLGKPIGDGDDYAESWEIADHDQGQSVVAAGPLAGTTLHALVEQRGRELLGRHFPQPRFPLLFKYLDCQRDLSVQVHPTDGAAARLDPPDLGKTEAWVILDAAPGSRVYAGLKPGCKRAAVERAIAEGRTAECLHVLEPRPGQCLFIPAGTVHALGAGLLVAEIQQASDTTYRLFDWDRLGPDGQPRALHISQALAAIDESAGPVAPKRPGATGDSRAQRLVACDKFVLDRWTIAAEGVNAPWRIGGDDRFHIISVLEGAVALEAADPAARPFSAVWLARGQTALLPAALGAVALCPQGDVVALEMYLPAA